MTARKIIRCAVYTRKSSEHNLDLEFNSLHAQREAGEAYVKSQMHEGWVLVPDHYDDGGISGGSLARPDLQRLLTDIQARKVDIVVVYKVDRLTRSLTDFAKLVELFDAHNVSFVSITQAFNTTSSMGRLTLNILLSFAQFEREVIGERVRDKVAASKRKGLWMGGSVPLGYINRDKKLVIVPVEAETVRYIFRQYIELGSVGLLIQDLRAKGIRSKRREMPDGRTLGGVEYGKGALTYLLKNRAYVGEIAHRGEIHPAEHEVILERSLFEAVQAKIQQNSVTRKLKFRSAPHLLTGLLFDSAGNRMSPSHTVKKGVRYRYYVSQGVLQSRQASDIGEVARISAPDVEEILLSVLHQRSRVVGDLSEGLRALARQIIVRTNVLEVHLARAEGSVSEDHGSDILSLPWCRRVTRPEKGVAHAPVSCSGDDARAREPLLAAIGRSRLWLKQLLDGVQLSEIARKVERSERQVRILLNLAFLPPLRVKALMDGDGPVDTITNLARRVPLLWSDVIWSPSAP